MGIQFCRAQPRTITGTVTGTENEQLIGVTVVIVGTTRGVVTDLDGHYSIQAQPGDELKFSFVGMEPQTRMVTEETTTIDVQLKSSVMSMEEVVVVGYGVQKKESKVAAISQTEGTELKRAIGGSDLANSLNGLMPGVISIRTNGMPGGGTLTGEQGINNQWKDDPGTEIYVRGRNTWNGGQPLILVDGVERRMSDVDPNEVQSVSVLKDASATAVFGVKGADGVILITTKRGSVSKPTLSFESLVTAKSLSKIPNTLNSYDVNYLKNLAIEHGVAADPGIWNDYTPWEVLQYYKTQEYPELYPDVDWAEEVTRDIGWSNRNNLNVGGGTEFVKYFLSLGHLFEGDIFKAEDFGQGYKADYRYQRFTFRSNLDFSLTKTTQFGLNLSAVHGRMQRPNNNNAAIYKSIYGNAPDLFPVRYSDGTLAYSDIQTGQVNGVYELNYYGVERGNRSELNADFILSQNLDFITKGLSVKARLSTDNRYNTSGPNYGWNSGALLKYISPGILNAETAEDSAKYIQYIYPQSHTTSSHGYNYVDKVNLISTEGSISNLYRSLYYELSMNYERSFGKSNFSGLFLFNRRENTTGSNFTNYREDWVGRVTYNFDSRYFFEFNGAYNGSEKFADEYRFGFFPSIAGGWMLSNEEFFRSALPFINTFKLRYSWGKVGNDAAIQRWQYVSSWRSTNVTLPFGSPFTQPGYNLYFEDVIANPNIHWEVSKKQNVALESGFFQSLFRVNFDYFWEHRTDMFISGGQRANNIIFGASLPSANIGEVKSRGWELELGFSKRFSDSHIWSKLSWSRNRDEIIYRDDPELRPEYQKQEGFPIGQTRTYVHSGIIQSWNEMYTGVVTENNQFYLPGDYRLLDYNADGIIDADDVVPYGYPSRPEYQYGFTLGYDYKGFSIMAQLYGVYNVNAMANTADFSEFNQNVHVAFDYHLNESWSPEMERTSDDLYPHVRYNVTSPKGSYFAWDLSYLRLQNMEISYTFRGAAVKRTGINNLRIFLLGNNILLWNKIPQDVDRPNYPPDYPLTKSFSLGANINF